MEELALSAFFVVVGFHSPGELIDGFGKLVEPFVEGMAQFFVFQGFGFG
jgi:hypothetical protein